MYVNGGDSRMMSLVTKNVVPHMKVTATRTALGFTAG
jgi:hypothetical protein